jgi:hypothetical protein
MIKKYSLVLVAIFCFVLNGFGQGLEDFTNSNANTSYANSSFGGNNSITWTYLESRDGNGDANGSGINLPALMLRNATSKITSSSISGGIGNFSVKLYKGFTGGGNRQVELFINNVSKGTSTVFDDYLEHTFTVNNINISGNVVIEIRNITAKQVIIDDISWTGYTGGSTPTITVTPTTLTGLDYVESSGPSSEQSFDIEGSNLTANIEIAQPTDFEISTGTGASFNANITDPIVLTQSGGTIASTPIYVRLKSGLSVATYNETITATSTGATDVDIDLEGTVSSSSAPCFSEDFTGLGGDNISTTGQTTAFTGNTNFPTPTKAYEAGDAVKLGTGSLIGSISSKSLTGISGNLTVTFDIKGWTTVEGDVKVTFGSSSQTVSYTATRTDAFESKSLIFTGIADGSILKFETTSKRAFLDNIEVFCGPVGPNISVTQTSLTGLDYFYGSGPSAAQSYQVSGSDLTPAAGNITVTAPANFSISKTVGGTYTNSLTYAYTGNTLAASDVFVKLDAGLAAGPYGPLDITHSGGGATTVNVAVSGEVTVSNNSDIVAISGSESATISSFINDTAPLNSSQGVQVWQFKVRDGGASLNDADTLPTILTAFTLAQNAGNQVGTWSNAIETIALFDTATSAYIATGTVTANQIQFTGLNISVTDNTERTLSLRLSLKCPLGPDAFDNEDFVFSLSKDNTTFSAAGSGKATFSAQTSANGKNKIDIDAKALAFTTQPVSTGVNSPMTDVVITAVDACGNKDVDFTGQVTLTSTGSMSPVPPPANAVAGVVTFSSIVHNVVASNRQMMASTTTGGISLASSTLFDITTTTTLNRGDLAIIAVNVNTEVFSGTQGGQDEIAFVCFKDILPGTTIYITDNGYEKGFAGEWGGTEGVVTITRIGSTLTKGTVIVFRSNNISGNVTDSSDFDIYTCGSIDTSWAKTAISGGSIGGFNLNKDDDIWIMQGGTWTNNIGDQSTYDGNVLYGWTESGWNTTPGDGVCGGSGANKCTKWSTIYPGLECFNTVAPVGAGYVKFNDPVNPDFSTTTNGRLDWIALINDTTNWDTYADNAGYISGGFDYKGSTACPLMTIAPTGYINGKWVGRADTNWFNCLNWDTLVIPDETVDVSVSANANSNFANVDSSAPYADYYGGIAKTKDLTISGKKVEISGSPSNVLEVHGNLLINSSGALDMDDGNNGTNDGLLYLYGNWINPNNDTFEEGNGTVIFTGSTPQVITYGGAPIPPITTEQYYNVILNNDFDTSVSNDLYLHGNLTINTNKTLTVTSNKYAYVANDLTVNGNFNIENNGSLVQFNDSGVNTGKISMKREATINTSQDYVYWASPINGFEVKNIAPSTSSNYIYKWEPTGTNANGTQGNWTHPATNEIMLPGKGYIVRVPASGSPELSGNILTSTFYTATNGVGVPNNGEINVTVYRGDNAVSDNDEDDNWNLIGNPYPSAISAMSFLNDPTNASLLDGYVNIWKHGLAPTSTVDPFYQDFVFNYYGSDYFYYDATGSSDGPSSFDGSIAAGQSFMVNMVDGPLAANGDIVFKNSMRNINYDNANFYRNSQITNEKNRIWLDLISPSGISNRILVGYIYGATMGRDRLYDAIYNNDTEQNFYSLINDDPFIIQGRGLPFEDTDVVPLGIKTTETGIYTISIYAVDGLFETDNQTIYLKDKTLNFIHNLSNTPYTFTSETGEFNNRFEIVFQTDALSVGEQTLSNNDLSIIELANGQVKFSIGYNLSITSVEIMDLLGRRLYNLKGDSATEVYNLSNLSQAAYIAKVKLSNGQTLIKRAIKRQ